MRLPARMKRGMARNGKVSMPDESFMGRVSNGMVPFHKKAKTQANDMQNATGTLTRSRTRNDPRRTTTVLTREALPSSLSVP
jgi:hypothetical protein